MANGRLSRIWNWRSPDARTNREANRVRRRNELKPSRPGLYWIKFLSGNALLTYFATGVLAFIVLYLLSIASHLNSQGFVPGLGLTIFGGLLSLALPFAITVAVLRKPLRPVLNIANQAALQHRTPILPFLTETLQQMQASLSLLQGDGAILDTYEVAAWVRRCFETATGTYFGTDSHVPSDYRELYADYLAAHSAYIDRTGNTESCRLLIVDISRLRTDRGDNEKAFEQFMAWHGEHPVTLSYLAPHDSEIMRASHSELAPVIGGDIGFWRGDFMLLFEPQQRTEVGLPPKVRLRISFQGEELYNQCEKYVTLLSEDAHVTSLLTELPIYSPELSEHWRQFCDPDERIKQTGKLLESVIGRVERSRDDLKILDGACGIGIETVYLLGKKYYVVSNEIETSLRSFAQEYASEKGGHIPDALFTRADWLHLDDAFPEQSYDVAFVLGNSLCHLETVAQVEQVVKQFHRLLKPGGFFICDERNFPFIQKNWETIKQDPWNNFRFNKRQDRVMYQGHHVLGAPVEDDHGRLIFEYREVSWKGQVVTPSEQVLGSLSMLPFPYGSLKRMLNRAGFESVETLADLKPETPTSADDADWFTYIAVKPAAPNQ